jgi:hypothetical protein
MSSPPTVQTHVLLSQFPDTNSVFQPTVAKYTRLHSSEFQTTLFYVSRCPVSIEISVYCSFVIILLVYIVVMLKRLLTLLSAIIVAYVRKHVTLLPP